MELKISFSLVDATVSPLKWVYQLEDVGFQGWEIVGEGLQRVEGEFKERVKEVYQTTNLIISLHAPLSDINIASVNERIWEESIRQIKESIKNAHEFIEDICVVHPGVFSPLSVQMPDRAFEKAITGLQILSDFASEYGLRIAVENLTSANMLMGRYPAELVRIVKGVNRDNLGICLDVAHANTTKTLTEFLDMNTKEGEVKIIHMHASDNFGADDLHLPLGRGNIDWHKVFNGIKDYDYKGLFVAELYNLDAGVESLEYIHSLGIGDGQGHHS